MYGEIPYKFKYMLNKIINCIIGYIMKNLNNNLLVESKLILSNNYILEVFHSSEISKNNITNNQIYNRNNNILNDKGIITKNITPKFDNNINLSKFSNVFLNISEKGKQDNINQYSKENKNFRPISPFKDKYKIIKLKKLLKNEQEKSLIKELSYLKRLTFVQEKLNYYELKNNSKDKMNFSNELENKSMSSRFIKEEKKSKSKISNKMNYITLINSCKNKKINLFKSSYNKNNLNTTRIIKHSLSQPKINSNKEKTDENSFLKSSMINLDKVKKSFELLKDKNNYIMTPFYNIK